MGYAQGPPINTGTPIMLGLEGRGVRTFVKFVRKATLRRDGESFVDPQNQRMTVRIMPVAIPYNLLSARFQVGAIVPFVHIDADSRAQSRSSSGLGDARLFAKYLLYQRDRRLETLRIAAQFSVKLPTGDEKQSPALGSGSTDFALSAVAGWIKNRAGVYFEGIYQNNTSGSAIDFGDSFRYNLAFGYRLMPVVYETYPSPQFNAFLELNGETAGRNRVGGIAAENTGGTTLFLSPGVQFVGGRRWLVEASLQWPVLNKLNGTQLATDWMLSVGTRVLVF